MAKQIQTFDPANYVTRAEIQGVCDRVAQLSEAVEKLANGLAGLSDLAYRVLDELDVSEPTNDDEPGQKELFSETTIQAG